MKAVGIKVLKNKLSEYIRLAAGGETILIADRDQVVAELVPPRETRSDSVPDALLSQMVRQGLIAPALFPMPKKPAKIGSLKLNEVLRDLELDRGR